MRFYNHESLDKEMLASITDVVIEHCVDVYCTCDCQVEIAGPGLMLVLDEDGIHVSVGGGVAVTHEDHCYSMGRNN
jgi:hypothetical protein